MKKTILILAFAFIALAIVDTSCTSGKINERDEQPKDGHFEYGGGVWSSMEYKIEEKTIDSCQYIIIFGSEGRNIIHKGNCRNHSK